MLPFMGNELLEGSKVKLVRPTRDDVPVLAEWSQDMEYSRLLRRGMVYPGSVEDTMGWFESWGKDEHFFPFMIRKLDDDRLIGMLAIKDVMWQARHCSFFIGIGKREDRGKGYGADALRVMLKYCFMEMNLLRVGLETMSYNPDAITAYERVGFVHEGRLRNFLYRDGVFYDMVLMGILREEWEGQQSPNDGL
jgi:hypothetical protein